MNGDRILIVLPHIGTLSMTRESFQVALAEGARAIAAPAMTTATDAEPLLDAEQLASALGLPVTRVEAAARSGLIPSVRLGRRYRFKRSAVEKALSTTTGGGARP